MSKSSVPCTTLNQFPVGRRIMQNGFIYVCIATFLLLRTATVSSECPQFCSCPSGKVVCWSASLTSIPGSLDSNTTYIDMSFNSISILDSYIFDNLPLLKTIVMSDNGVKVVEPEVFYQLQGLREIDLHNNNIGYIHPSLFMNNLELSRLDLSCNDIPHLRLDFTVNTELTFLNLSSNMLKFEDLTLFLPITSLQILDLSNNQIETVSGEVFDGMVDLKHLNISGNPQLEYDCRLRTLWTLCCKQNITCTTDDEQSFRMVDNLYCGTEEMPKVMSLTEETDELLSTSATEDSVNEGSGVDSTESISDNNAREFNSTVKVPIEPSATLYDDWLIIVIAVCSVCAVVIIIVAVISVLKYRHSRGETSRNVSRTNSIDYLNQEDQFDSSYKNPRNDSNKIRNQYDRVIPSGFSRNVLQFQVADSVTAEVVRVPSFKTRGVATPLNLPEEISPQETELTVQNKSAVSYQSPVNSLSRSNRGSPYEQSETERAGSVKYKKYPEMSRSNIQYALPEKRKIPPNRRS